MLVRPAVWSALRRELAEFLLPQRCVACGAFGAALHPDCVERLELADGSRCPRCWGLHPAEPSPMPMCPRCTRRPVLGLEARRAAFRFDGVARRAILEAKFRGVTALFPPLAQASARAVPAAWEVDSVVPVPLHAARRRERGFDQGALIAAHVAETLGVPVRRDLIERVRRTRPQASLGRADRTLNVAGAFGPRRGHGAPPARALLVDDVVTTGETLEAAAGALRAAGVERVFALALAVED